MTKRNNGEGGLSEYQTKAGTRYRITWREPIDPTGFTPGERQRSKGGFTDKRVATTELRKTLADIEEGRHVTTSGLTVGEYASRWVDTRRIDPTTRAGYRRYIRLHINAHIGQLALDEVKVSTLAGLYRTLESEGRRSTGHLGEALSPNTVRKVHVLLGSILQAAVDDGLLLRNPARHPRAEPPTARQIRDAQPEIHPWTADELDRFLGWADQQQTDQFRYLWTILGWTGLRAGELLGLRWGDVDLKASTIAVRRSRTLIRERGKETIEEESSAKSGRSRVVNFGPTTAAALRAQRGMLAEVDLRMVARDARVAARIDDRPLNYGVLYKHLHRVIARHNRCSEPHLEVPVIGVHDLRHTHATLLLQAGVHPKIVQERLGHRTITITMETYSHVMPTMQEQAVAALEGLMRTANNPTEAQLRGEDP